MNYNLDNDLKEETYQQSNPASSFVRLPFDVPIWYWKHGDANIDAGSIAHFGRWNCGVEEYDQIAQVANIATPKHIENRVKKDQRGVPKSGENYRVYASRVLVFAVIASRSRWFFNKSTGKNNSHVQILAHLFAKDDQGIVKPTIPVVLSAKVLASGALENAQAKWFDHIRSFGPNIPPMYFYMAVGTFGEESKFSGAHGTSTIPELYIKKDLTAESLPFVGNPTARKMSELKLNAQDWLNDQDWLNPSQGNQQQPPQDRQTAYQQPAPAPSEDDSEIPF